MPRRAKAITITTPTIEIAKADAIVADSNESETVLCPTAAESPLSEPPDEVEAARPRKRSTRPKRKAVKPPIVVEAEGEVDGDGEEKPKKKRRRKTPEEDKVYEMPRIGNVLPTTFKGQRGNGFVLSTELLLIIFSGRLGYACLNSLLRSYSTPIFCSRTLRLATLSEQGQSYVQALALQNLADLHTLVKWNAEHNIHFMRMSSEMFPFASHPVHGYDLSFADPVLKEIGETARRLGVRLTSHPGQFTQLGSPRDNVVENAFRDLKCERDLFPT